MKFLKYLNIFRHYFIGNNLPYLRKFKKTDKIKNKRILIATSTGGLQSINVFEGLVGNILMSEGCQVDFLLCDEILSGCTMTTIFNLNEKKLVRDGSKSACSFCFLRAKNFFESFGGKVLKFSNFIDDDKISEIRKTNFNNLSINQIKKFSVDDIPIGEHANSGTIRYYTGTNLEDYELSKDVMISYLKSSLITLEVCKNLFKNNKYDEVFLNHGVYVPQGIIMDYAKLKNINCSAWFYNYKNNSVCITRNDTYHKALLNEDKQDWDNFDFSMSQEKEIDKYLKSKRYGSMDMEVYFNNPSYDIDAYFKERKITKEKPIISLATNMLWDAQVYFPTNFFDNMIDWLYFTIDYFEKRKDLQLLIRIHPAETDLNKPSKQRVEDSIRKKYKKLPENIFLIKPDDTISTYSIIDQSNCLIVYGSKIATESAAQGIPTIVCGESFIKNKSITFDAFSKKDYTDLLDRLPFEKNIVSKNLLKKAKKYAYHFWFRKTISISSLFSKKNKSPNVGVKKNYDDLYYSNKDLGLKTVIESILENKNFIDQ